MQLPKTPIKTSGWFYLWLFIMAIGLWGEHRGYFDSVESANLKLWTKTDRVSSDQSKIVRVLDISFDLNGLNKIQQLAKKFPHSTFGFMGRYGDDFLEQLSQPEFIELAKKSVLLSEKNYSSLSSLSNTPSKFDYLLGLVHLNPLLEIKALNWRVSSQAKFALQPHDSHSSNQLVWRSDNKYYPSFIGQVIIGFVRTKSQPYSTTNPILSNKNKLSMDKHSYHFGYQGEIYARGQKPDIAPYHELLNNWSLAPNAIILVDDMTINQSGDLASSLYSLVNGNYLYSSVLILLFKYLLMLFLLVGIFRMKNLSIKKQLVIFLSGIVILFLFQSFFVSQLLWLSVSLIIILCLVSWLLQLGYCAEAKHFTEQNNRQNELLSDATPIFYNTQNLEKLLPHLEQSSPDLPLIDSVYEIAIEAEAHRNAPLAKKLHEWILSHNKRFSPSLERMAELAPSQNQETELDQTLVIDADGKKATAQVNSILNVTNFGRYQVDGILGKGAMGVVFQGVDPKINRYVAIKTLQLNDELDGQSLVDTKQRFFREAETAGNLSHANIVTIYDVGEERQPNSNQTLGYIAMDLLTGAPLSEYIKKGKLLPPSLVYQLMIQMTDALDYAHRQKVIHRDIKPANIIYDDDLQRGTVTDFGIAYMSDHSKTKTGTIMGSPYYMSPEQILGIKIDGRSDIFSLGVTFYQLLSGHLPFTGESIASVAFHITKTKHESVKKWNNKLPSSAARITNKAMQKEADKRFQTMQEFKQALVNALKRDYKKSPLS